MTEEKEIESGELVVIKEIDIPALFKKDGCNPIIEGLKKKAAEFEGDISTAKGRKAIASFAAKFSSSKAHIDRLGKSLTDKLRDEIEPIQAERNKIKACCDELRDQVRKPLTDWENAEKERVVKHEQNIQTINDYLNVEPENSGQAKDLLEAMKEMDTGECFEEFELAATKAKTAALTQLEAKFIVLQHAEKEKAEADRLEKERLAKEQEEREKKIAEEAAEKATREAEDKAKAEGDEKDRLAKEAIEKAERETLEAKLATERAEREKKEAAELAEKEKEAAIEEERKRVAAVKESERIAEEKLAQNKAHRGKLNKEAKQSFIDEGFEAEEAEKIIKVIAKGRIANITINY
jgi:hypothetical protein